MKQKIRSLINQFIGNLNIEEKKISVKDLSIFFSVLLATFSLRKNSGLKIDSEYASYRSAFASEFELIQQRFPELMDIFSLIESQIRTELLINIFEKLDAIYQEEDGDLDDIISWSYQYLKRDLEKAAFKKVGQDNVKIKNSDLLFTTQFFTDKYMVKYIVTQALSGFKGARIRDVVLIDCASGGGNFLTYGFNILFRLYQQTFPSWSNQAIVDVLLQEAITGYDLDNNLSKIAALSLFVKASIYAIPSPATTINIYGGQADDNLGFLNPDIISDTIGALTFRTRLDKIDKAGKIKVFLTNPPFMGKRDMDTSLKNYLQKNIPESKGDLCVSFIQRIIQEMNGHDRLGVVSQNNWLYLSSFSDFRKMFLEKETLIECVDLGSNAFEDIKGEKTNIALFIIGDSSDKTTHFYNLKNLSYHEKKKMVSDKAFPIDLTFSLAQHQFLKNNNFEFNYHLEHRFENIQKLDLYANFGSPMQGTSTGNNAEFVKFAWEVNGNPDWKLVSKGGGFSKWMGLNYYKVNWGTNAEKIKSNKGSALRNIDKIPNTQLVYSDTGTLGLNVRILKENQVFIASGPGIIVSSGDMYAHLAFLNSKVATFLLKLINPKFTISAGYISKIPVAPNILNDTFIADLSRKCLALKEEYLKGKLPNIEFEHQEYHLIKDLDAHLKHCILSDLQNDYQRLLLESEIEAAIRKQYNFDEKELKELNSVVGELAVFNKKKMEETDIEKLDMLLSKTMDINCFSSSKSINGFSVGSESILEDLSYKLDTNPSFILSFIKKNISQFKTTKAKYFNDLLHKIMLYELGVKQIFTYKSQVVSIESLIRSLKKYTFLAKRDDLLSLITPILLKHHQTSFFNKPLISLSGESLTIGYSHNG
ncbi:Eco57I restriction-modification methylase domain-containing protein [Chitinophaga pinensis]|uniref:Eco57I restriction-modification methylase domain-containing protein n=1 Tax=Chitinophaga pinensis TaxID=79329 RepID=UPI0005C64478|nr:N-6 DNA methylase [Chitinophaga pinensis]